MKILIAPLNWGLGHATRCVPIIRKYIEQGHEVVLGGDGESLIWLYRYFPTLRFIELAPLSIRYSASSSQVGAILKAIPELIRFSREDHRRLKTILEAESFDVIISDNRFGLYDKRVTSIYITHQLTIRCPRRLRFMEPLLRRIHRYIYRHYDEIWVPDYEDPTCALAGDLSHLLPSNSEKIKYIGPLSRFEGYTITNPTPYHAEIVAVLSGPEPQRSILEAQLIARHEPMFIVRGLITRPFMVLKHGDITLVPWLKDEDLVPLLQQAKKIICRSGYTSIMDLHALGVLDKAELIPTPGQSEQEYLATISHN